MSHPASAHLARLAAVLATLLAVAPLPAQRAIVFRDVRLFDGERVTPSTTVVVRDGRVAAIAPGAEAPAGAEVVEGAGRTLLPGLVDAHTHTMSLDQLRGALAFGVVKHLDMFTPPALIPSLRHRSPEHADLHTAGVLVTAPGGHGTQFGVSIPTISSPAEAPAYVAARVADGSEWIKLAVDDFSTYGARRPTLDSATVAAVVREAHRLDRKVVAHVASLASARAVVGAGVDGLVHVWVDAGPPADLVADMRSRNLFVIPTLTVTRSIAGTGGSAPLLEDSRIAPLVGPLEATNAATGFPRSATSRASYDSARASVAALVAAGVPVLAGTDAPNPGTIYGAAMHRELELLVEAGLTPLTALRAATSVPADVFALRDAGRVAVGMPAHLLLVEGDPTTDVTATRAIVGVWKDGVRFDRAAYAVAVAAARRAASEPARPATAGVVSDFEDGRPSSTIGAGWMPSTDAMAGGTSSATLTVAPGGAVGSAHALRVEGTVRGGAASTWSGAMWFPAAQPMSPGNLSATGGFGFHARGDGATYDVLVFTREGGTTPRVRSFRADAEWTEHAFTWSDFATDATGILGVAIVSTTVGDYRLQLDRFALTAR